MITRILNYIIEKITKSSNRIKTYEFDKDGIVPRFNSIGGKNGQSKKIKNRKNN